LAKIVTYGSLAARWRSNHMRSLRAILLYLTCGTLAREKMKRVSCTFKNMNNWAKKFCVYMHHDTIASFLPKNNFGHNCHLRESCSQVTNLTTYSRQKNNKHIIHESRMMVWWRIDWRMDQNESGASHFRLCERSAGYRRFQKNFSMTTHTRV